MSRYTVFQMGSEVCVRDKRTGTSGWFDRNGMPVMDQKLKMKPSKVIHILQKNGKAK